MTQGLPVSRLINVDVVLTPSAAQIPNLNSGIIIGDSDVINVSQRYRSFGTIEEVATLFGTSAPEYLAATLFFGQSPQPDQLYIGRWASAATKGLLLCGSLSAAEQTIGTWQAIVDGGFKVNVNGGGVTAVVNLDFSGAANLNAVAALIDAGLTTAGLAASCVWNSEFSRFEFNTNAGAAGNSISFLTAPTNGDVDISAVLKGTAATDASQVAGIAAETPVAAYTILDGLDFYFYASMFASTVIPTDEQYVAVAAYVEAANNKHVFGITSDDTSILTANDTDNIAYDLKTLGYNRSFVQYCSTNAYAVASFIGRFVTVDFNGSLTVITMMYKQEPGVAAESLTSGQADACQDANCNVFVNYNNDTMIIQYGTMASGTFFDDVYDTDWLGLAIQNNVFNLLYTSATKIPQTNAGNHLIANAIEAACVQGVVNGTLAPGQWNGPSFGQLETGGYLPKGYYIYTPDISSQSQGEREARRSVTFQVAAKLAGAVHTVDIVVNVNR